MVRSVRRAFTEGVQVARSTCWRGSCPGKARAARRDKALATFAGMVGAIVLARAVDDAELSADILEAVRESIAAESGSTLAVMSALRSMLWIRDDASGASTSDLRRSCQAR